MKKIGKWSEISIVMIPDKSVGSSLRFVNKLSIREAVEEVIRVGLLILGFKDKA